MAEHIETHKEGAVLRVAFARPEKKNAITGAMYGALVEAFEAYAADDGLRALVLHGEGGSFTAGNDLRDFLGAGSFEGDPPAFAFIKAIHAAEKPVIVAVEGWAVGIGATILLHADLVFMARSATLRMPFTELGVVPEAGASRLLPRRHGRQVASELFFLQGGMSAQRAYEVGLCNAVTDDGGALPRALEAAEQIARLSPDVVKRTKRLMREPDDLMAHMTEEVRQFGECLRSDEMQAKLAFMTGAKG
ncbi:enoyl-CoA hydratase-related protein [Parvularcula dongshanensis]|uniref:Enoyl-CoA hydratase/carnithine racemase n=1 Tax=Parvularcula dongshanensis TaxID=1173995 RepID=A0A840I265_9PROT|nr:enoyl-CoA hydratase-related protein [Parvularcula dongshanensis]MBB4658837.1 enoyl-CoA hydratase/carnithine racemase [Parvularcula dongshanensis]